MTLETDAIPSISPVLFYSNLADACAWLTRAFGFDERVAERVTLEDGSVAHAELALGDGMVTLSPPYEEFQVPNDDSVHHHCLYLSIADAQAHRDNSVANGAKLTSELRKTDYGALVYSARDFAGYHWIFAQSLR